MDDDDVYRIPSWDEKEPAYDQELLVKLIFRVLAASDKPLQEFDIVQGVLRAMKPQEIWYQMVVKTLQRLHKEDRVFAAFRWKDTEAEKTGIQLVITTYTISNPLDGLAAL
jgi:hypothetical protein